MPETVPPSITLITPTRDRAHLLPRRLAEMQAQTVTDWEWLIFHDGGPRDPYLDGIASPQIRYVHSEEAFVVGEKRNVMADLAKAPVIAHIDDDDHYAPGYMAAMLALLTDGVELATLSAWYVYDARHHAFGYWDCRTTGGVHQRWARAGIDLVNAPEDPAWSLANRRGYGFSYIYRKSLWERSPFPAAHAGEDLPLAEAAAAAGTYTDFPDEDGLCVHILHGGNASLCLPQYRLPPFLLDRLFGPAGRAAVEG